ncbi:hypothetical protein GDO86_005521 [Hymenochirus boettgeri]|uniref:Regulator of G-protein signaling 14 n=1 Tax=Hymenochirus boettgeri TaxID=247094 RepID=A0A8T2JA64_9PIPI|nr:hypothetical protein GDO86_005521 [Hymenochirus boettgeri]
MKFWKDFLFHNHHKELNHSDIHGRGSNHSLNSLPSAQITGHASEKSVASWAVSFERLLQDPLGIEYFTEFLKMEYSAENIFFWKECEKFHLIANEDSKMLSHESHRIYDEYLSTSSLCPVNVDHQAVITEDMLDRPSPHMFDAQQQQIFNLMKFDSYARFVKSPMYQECMLAEVEGRPLPSLNSSSTPPDANCTTHTSGKKKLRAGKSLPIGIEGAGMDTAIDKLSRRSFKKKDKKGHHKEASDSNGHSSRRESQISLNSNNSLELSLISSKSENEVGSTSSVDTEIEAKSIKYCCVYLPDGTASLTAIKADLTIQEMLAGVCEKRGYCPTDVKVFLVGHEEKALALDQECLVLADQEVRLENRISFELQIDPINKSFRIMSKPTKTIGEALHPVLEKYGLENQHFVLRKVGDPHALHLKSSVNEVAGQKLVLETLQECTNSPGHTSQHKHREDSSKKRNEDKKTPITEHICSPQKKSANCVHESSLNRHHGVHGKPKCHHMKDIEGLVELLNKAQCSRADDQRGLLCKEDLVLPEFLKLPKDDTCNKCYSLDNSREIKKNLPCNLDHLQAPEYSCEQGCSTNTISTIKTVRSGESEKKTESGIESVSAGTVLNTDKEAEMTISNHTSFPNASTDNNSMHFEKQTSV